MCSKIVVALALCLVQVIALPGMGMMGGGMMGGGMMGGGMMGGGMMGGMGMMGGGVDLTAIKTMATFNKQLGMSQAFLNKNIMAAKNEVKLQIDALKTAAKAAPPGDLCGSTAEAEAMAIENELKLAFNKCQMKTELQELRFQSLSLKQQMATMKMAKKACKLELDPVQCLADVTEGTNNGVTQVTEDVNAGLTDVMTDSADCITEVKEELAERIDEATDNLLLC